MAAAVLHPGGARQELRALFLAALHQVLIESRYRVKFLIDLLGHFLATLPILLTAWAFSDGRASERLAELTGLPDQFTFMMLGLIAFTAMGIGNLVLLETNVAGGLANEMETGTLERLFTMPVHRLSLVLGIAIYYLILFCYQSITLFAGATLLVGFEPAVTAGSLPWVAPALAMLLALNLFLGIAAASFVMAFKDHSVAYLLFHRPMAMLSGAYFLVELIPIPFRWLAYANPVAYAIDVFRGALTGTTLLAPSVETGMAIVAGMVVGVGLLSVLLFRRMMVRLERTGSLALF